MILNAYYSCGYVDSVSLQSRAIALHRFVHKGILTVEGCIPEDVNRMIVNYDTI